MKKILALLLAAAISVSSFCACSSKNDEDSSSMTRSEQLELLKSNNKISEYIYSAINRRLAAHYAEGKSIVMPGVYLFEFDKTAEDYVYINQKEMGTAITTMTAAETYTFLIYTATNFKNYAENPTDAKWPKVKQGYAIVVIDSSQNLESVYFSDEIDGTYTGAYPISPTSPPSYTLQSIVDEYDDYVGFDIEDYIEYQNESTFNYNDDDE
ncbi:MAG: hypothetical protein ACI4I6_08460 [Hominimerdicola sp.]